MNPPLKHIKKERSEEKELLLRDTFISLFFLCHYLALSGHTSNFHLSLFIMCA